jgi:hypothetical protein
MVVITLDIDWAPDFMIDDVADILIRNRVKATWFVTHNSAAVDRLRAVPELFELGLHPNFFPSSTHGKSTTEVLRHCFEIVPDARCFRTHGLVQSTPILDAAMQTGLEIDLSLFLPNGYVTEPLEYWRSGRRLWRLPYVWEDDMEMEQPVPSWSADEFMKRRGVQVVDFHPIHIWLNAPDLRAYEALKSRAPELTAATRADAEPLRRDGAGPGQLFSGLVAKAAAAGKSWRVRDVLAEHAQVSS